MKYEIFTNVILKDGREGAIVEVYDDGYLVDVSPSIIEVGDQTDYIVVAKDSDIKAVLQENTKGAE